jgi:hypothetical protein
MWGIFRDVYDMEYIILEYDGKYPITPDGIQLKTSEAINLYCNNINAPMGCLRKLYFSLKEELSDNTNKNIKEVIKSLGIIKNFINERSI